MARSRKLSRKGSRKASKKASRKASRKGSRKASRTMKSLKQRRSMTGNPCRRYKKSECGPMDPNCQWRSRSGCVRRKNVLKGSVYEGPRMM